jgi:general secretion pathway protein I
MTCSRRPVPIASCREAAGFTLLEVMVAMAVLGIALLALLTLHHQSLQSVIHSRDISRAGMLCQTIMSQAELEQFPQLGVTKGNFERYFPGQYQKFRWERDVLESGVFPDVRKVRVIVFYGPKFSRTFSITEYLHNPVPITPAE